MATSGVQNFSLTVGEIINMAMLDIGALPIGETPTADETSDAIRRLNVLIYSLMNRVPIKKLDVQTLTMSVGTINYALASATKRLVHMWFTNSGGDWPIDILDYPDYDAITDKTTEGLPLYARVNYNTEPPTIDMYPVPDAEYTYKYRRTKAFDSITATTEEVDFPQESLDLIIKGLAYSLAHSYQLPIDERMVLKQDFEQAKALYFSNDTERHGQEIVMPKGVLIV